MSEDLIIGIAGSGGDGVISADEYASAKTAGMQFAGSAVAAER